MSIVNKTVVVNGSLDAVWEQVNKVGNVENWHPMVKQAPVLTANDCGIGATRRCEFHDGTSVVEKVTASKEREMVELELSDFSMPLSRAIGTIRLKELGPERIEVSLTMDYDVKYGPIGWLMDAAMMKPMMGRMLGQVLSGLDQFIVTGDVIENVDSLHAAA